MEARLCGGRREASNLIYYNNRIVIDQCYRGEQGRTLTAWVGFVGEDMVVEEIERKSADIIAILNYYLFKR
jgi:hypothetical protein